MVKTVWGWITGLSVAFLLMIGVAVALTGAVFLGSGNYAECPSEPTSATVGADLRPTESTYTVHVQKIWPMSSSAGDVDIVNDKKMEGCPAGSFIRLSQDKSGVWKAQDHVAAVFPNKILVVVAFYGLSVAAGILAALTYFSMSRFLQSRFDEDTAETVAEITEDDAVVGPDYSAEAAQAALDALVPDENEEGATEPVEDVKPQGPAEPASSEDGATEVSPSEGKSA